MTLFEQLFNKTKKDVKNFASDFEVDKKVIEKYNGRKFIHFTRESGTSIHIFYKTEDLPKKEEVVSYLFGTAKREVILKNNLEALEYYAENNPISTHFFNGEKLVKTNPEEAIDIFKNYINRLKARWTEEDLINTTDKTF